MRMLKKRVHIISLFLILSFLFLPAASILMIHHITVSSSIVSMDAGFFGASSSAFAIREESITMREAAAVAAACGKNIAVYQDYKGPEQVRAIYFSGTYANLPMMEGRFFQESDFTVGNRCAVVGKNRRSELVQRGGKAYIELQGVPFEVLGVMGPEEETAFDSTVLINGLAEPELFRDILYRLDFFRIDGEQRADAFAAKMQADYVAEAEEIAQSAATLSRLIPNVVYGRWFLVILLCDLLCVALLSLEWKNRKQKEVCIKRLLGCPTRRVGWEICLEYGAMVVAAGAAGALLCAALFPQYLRFLGLGFACYLPCALVFSLIMVCSLLEKPITEAMK